ncbi:MAG: efflux transporter outer membrane subunit [Desulfarculaceae bacterium]
MLNLLLSCRLFVLPLALLIFSLSGCIKVGPDYKPPRTDLPEAWHLPQDPALKRGTTDIVKWWDVFEDPALSSLIGRAAKGNLDVRVAMAKVKEAWARVGVATGDQLPSLEATGEATHQRTSENDVTPGGASDNRLTAGLNASWEIDLFGRIGRSIEAAQADYEASEEDRRDVMVSLFAEVARAYLEVRTAQSRLVTALENIRSQKETLNLTQARFRNGLATGLDVAQAESVLASTEAQVPPLQIDLAQSINNVAKLLGLHPGALRAELREFKEIPVPPAQVTVGIPADLLRQRPDIRRAERQLAAQTARIGVATADLYPSFSILGSFGFAAAEGGDLFKAGSRVYSVGPSFSWPIFQGGRIRNQIKVEDALTEQSLLLYESTTLSALHEVENAFVAYVKQRERIKALRRSLKASRKTMDLSIKLYKEGLSDFQNVLDAQRSLLEVADNLVVAQGQASSDLVDLYKAMGGGWDPEAKPKEQGKPPVKAAQTD